MHEQDQPKTTKQKQARDAAVQIGAERPNSEAIKDRYEKATQIWRGATNGKDDYSAGFWLSIQLQWLTSANKDERNLAKQEIRRLVKLGKGE